MADITDIKNILYTEKTLSYKESDVIVFQTSLRVTKNKLKQIIKENFGFSPLQINSLRQSGKAKRFRNRMGKRADFKKFYVKVPQGASISSL